MEVVKKGSQFNFPITRVCDCCQSTLKFTEADGTVEMRLGSKLLHVVCPECSYNITVMLSKPVEPSPYTMQATA